MSICSMETIVLTRALKGGVCPCGCGTVMVKGSVGVRICPPYQKRGVTICPSCYANGGMVDSIDMNNTPSENCNEHIAIIKTPLVDLTYFAHYGFKKCSKVTKDGLVSVKARFKNAESCGVTIPRALKEGYLVKINGKVVADVTTYDTMTKKVCMR